MSPRQYLQLNICREAVRLFPTAVCFPPCLLPCLGYPWTRLRLLGIPWVSPAAIPRTFTLTGRDHCVPYIQIISSLWPKPTCSLSIFREGDESESPTEGNQVPNRLYVPMPAGRFILPSLPSFPPLHDRSNNIHLIELLWRLTGRALPKSSFPTFLGTEVTRIKYSSQ